MDKFSEKLNLLLVETFRDILKFEEKMLRSFGRTNLSISEIHMIEAVGKNKNTPKTISELAENLNITSPSVTNAIKRLEAGGYVQKIRSESDGRSVLVMLTQLGRKVNYLHQYFHKQMVRALTEEFDEQEKEILFRGIEKLDKFFKGKLRQEKIDF